MPDNKPRPKKISPEDPRDANKDGTFSVAEQKAWTSQTPDTAAGQWDLSLAVVDAIGLRPLFDEWWAKYRDNPAGFSDAAFKVALKATPQWQQYGDQYLKDLQFEKELPQAYQQQLDADVESLRDTAVRLGSTVDDNVLRDLAQKKRRGLLNDAQMQNALSGYLTLKDERFQGAAGKAQDSVMTWARDNGLALSDSAVRTYVQRMASGDTTEDDVKNELRRTYLVGKYPAWADKIEAGYDPADLFSPYVQDARKLLENDNLSLDDPIMQKITQGVDANGKPVVVPLYQAQQMIRQDPRWQRTNNAYDTYASVADDVLRMFGFRG